MINLVTGATGFIGGHLARALLARGEQVRALVRDPKRGTELQSLGAELVEGDLTRPETLRQAAEGATRTYHCGAVVGERLTPEQATQINIEGTRALLDACAYAGIQRCIYISSLAVLGMDHQYGTDETAPVAPSDLYGDSKIGAEAVVQEFVQRGALEAVILRPGYVYGPEDRQFLPPLLNSLARGEFMYVGDGSKVLCCSYVTDLADAALLAAAHPNANGQVYHITDGTRTSVREFVTFLCEYLGVRPPKGSIPAPVALAACSLFAGLERLTRSKFVPPLNQARMRFIYCNQDFSITKARRELGYSPKFTYREGLPPTLDWFHSEGLIPHQLSTARTASAR